MFGRVSTVMGRLPDKHRRKPVDSSPASLACGDKPHGPAEGANAPDKPVLDGAVSDEALEEACTAHIDYVRGCTGEIDLRASISVSIAAYLATVERSNTPDCESLGSQVERLATYLLRYWGNHSAWGEGGAVDVAMNILESNRFKAEAVVLDPDAKVKVILEEGVCDAFRGDLGSPSEVQSPHGDSSDVVINDYNRPRR